MNNFDNQGTGTAHEDAPEDFEIEISDLPPGARSHYLLIRLDNAKTQVQAATRALLLKATHGLAQNPRSVQEGEQQGTGDFELEISDLPPNRRSHYLLLKLVAFSRRLRAVFPTFRAARDDDRAAPPQIRRARRRAGIGRALTTCGICATILLLIVGNVPNLRSQVLGFFEPRQVSVVAANTSNFGPVPVTIGRFGSASGGSLRIYISDGSGQLPASCPRLSPLHTFTTPLDPPGLGGGPLWISGFVGPTATLVNLQPTVMSQTVGNAFIGWYETVAVFIQKGFTGGITLRGQSQGNGGAVMFSYANSLIFHPSLTLSLGKAGSGQIDLEGSWEMIPINILVSNAGCYSLQASWPNNGWIQYFAAGD